MRPSGSGKGRRDRSGTGETKTEPAGSLERSRSSNERGAGRQGFVEVAFFGAEDLPGGLCARKTSQRLELPAEQNRGAREPAAVPRQPCCAVLRCAGATRARGKQKEEGDR
jgi:hypothetical protein